MAVHALAQDRTRFRRKVYSYPRARTGFKDFLAHAIGTSRRVLLPAFIGWSPREGSGVFDPISALELEPVFYRLNDDLSCEVGHLTELLAAGPYRALLLVHYFGRTDPGLDAIAELARIAGVPLVEDCAHALFTAAATGHTGAAGAAALYSLHKMLPMPAGGLLSVAPSTGATGMQSQCPSWAEDLLSYNLPAIAATRQANFVRLSDLLQEHLVPNGDVHLLWPQLVNGDVPQTLPIKILRAERDLAYRDMNAQGYGVVSLYHTLIQELPEEHEDAPALARVIINLPVHQDVNAGDYPALVAALTAVLRSHES